MTSETNDVLAFFGSSPTRLTALEALCEEAIPKEELQERIDTSRITLWRLLGDFEDREWVGETGAGYEATVAGRVVVEQLTSMNDALQALEELDDILEWLPLDEMDFSIVRLADAEIVRPTPSDPQGPMRLATRQIREATTIRILSHGYAPRVVETMHELGMAGDQSGVLVTSTGLLERFVEEPSMREKLGDLIEAEQLEYFHYHGEVPHIFSILDGERVGMGVDDDDGRTASKRPGAWRWHSGEDISTVTRRKPVRIYFRTGHWSPMTDLRYLPDNDDVTRFEATVEAATEDDIVLDGTYFYPEGGGQPPDHGTISWDGGEATIDDVRKDHGDVKHFIAELDGEVPEPGTEVHGEIDAERRRDLRRMHTAQHVVSRVVLDEYDATTAGNQIYPDRSRIDFEPADFDAEDVSYIEERSNEVIEQDMAVTKAERPRDEVEAETDEGRALLNLIPDSVDPLRVVEIEDYDYCPCGGTHVDHLGEIGRIEIVDTTRKGADTERIEFVLHEE